MRKQTRERTSEERNLSFMQAAAWGGAEEAHHPCKSKGSFVNTTSDSTSAKCPCSLSLSTTHLASRSSVGAFFLLPLTSK